MPVNAGDRDRPITIEQLPEPGCESVDPEFFPTEAWTPLATVFAERIDGAAEERMDLNQLTATATVSWRCEFREDLDPEVLNIPKTRRVRANGRLYEVVSARQIGRREGVILVTLEKTG